MNTRMDFVPSNNNGDISWTAISLRLSDREFCIKVNGPSALRTNWGTYRIHNTLPGSRMQPQQTVESKRICSRCISSVVSAFSYAISFRTSLQQGMKRHLVMCLLRYILPAEALKILLGFRHSTLATATTACQSRRT
jgi:hypothetical protein